MELTLVPLNFMSRLWLTPDQIDKPEYKPGTIFSPSEFIRQFQPFERYSVRNTGDLEADEIPSDDHVIHTTIIERVGPRWHPEPLDIASVFVNGAYACAFPDGPMQYALSFSQFMANSFDPSFVSPVGNTKLFHLLNPEDDGTLVRSVFLETHPVRHGVGLKIFDH
jgi:hypothetical protein